MPTAIAMPRLGMTMTEGTVLTWPVPLGGRVEKGQVVLTIESEKAEVEIEAPASGVLRHVYVEPDRTVPCGTLLAALTEAPRSPSMRKTSAGGANERSRPAAHRVRSPFPLPRPLHRVRRRDGRR